MLEIDHGWTSTGDTAGTAPVRVGFGVSESVLYFDNSTIATTNGILFQTAPESTGPWITEASTDISTAGSTAGRFRVTGPYGWARVVLRTVSTGSYRMRLIGVS